MRNAATYASLISSNFTEYEDLPGHHLLSMRSLIASSLDESYPETASSIADDVNFFMNNFAAEEAEDYSVVRDLDAFRSFQLATAYCLTCSEDSSEGDYDPARECFKVQLADGQDDNIPGNDGRRGRRAGEPTGGATCGPFFFIKLSGTASTADTAQGASSQARRAASADPGAAHRTRAAAYRAWCTCPGGGTCCC